MIIKNTTSLDKILFTAFVANLILTIIQFYYSFVANSNSLFADASHNLADCFGLLLALIGNLLLNFEENVCYSFGLKKFSIISAFLNAIILFSTSIYIVIESMHRILLSEKVDSATVIWVALLGVFVNLLSGILLLRNHSGHDDINIQAAVLHLLGDAAVSFSVFLGAVVIMYYGWYIIDPILGILIAIVLLYSSLKILKKSTILIMDGVPKSIDYNAIKNYVKVIPEVLEVEDLHIWPISIKEFAVILHVVLKKEANVNLFIKNTEKKLTQHFKLHHISIQTKLEE